MKKLTLLSILFTFVVLSWCSMSDLMWKWITNSWDAVSNWDELTGNTCGIVEDTSCETESSYHIVNWEFDWTEKNIPKIIKIFDDLNVIDNSYGYLSEQAGKQELSLESWDELSILSGKIILKKDWKEGELFPKNNNNKDDLWWILWLNEDVVALFWPYVWVFDTWDISFVYLTKSQYWEWVKQHNYSLSESNDILDDILLYHNLENDIVISTNKSEKGSSYNYENINVYKKWIKNIVLTWWFDSFTYNWTSLYVSIVVDYETNNSDVFAIDLSELTSKKILSQKNIWHEWKFFVTDGILYVSFWVLDFVNESVSHHISAYDNEMWVLLREVKLD
jgi:hypothetical protein